MIAPGFTLRRASAEDMPDVFAVDDDATALYREAGIVISLSLDHPFTVAERSRWTECALNGGLVLAVDISGAPAGFAAVGSADGLPYLDQLSVRRSRMRQGVGRALLRHAIAQARGEGASALWLTTYSHLPWNRPFYEREGFAVAPESACGPDILHHVEEQRLWLPAPEARVAMRKPLGTPAR